MSQINAEHLKAEVATTRDQRMLFDSHVMAGAETLTGTEPSMQILDPGGAARNLTFPALTHSPGKVWYIVNNADAAEAITLKDAAASTIGTVAQNEMGMVFSDGVAWHVYVGVA